ncbi:MAG: plastocyanin/azurin family copper-binding protein [Solirubrobacterales bacterium]
MVARIHRRSALAALAAALACVLALGGVAGAGGSKTVKLGDNFFDPARTSVAKDTKVRFKWVNTQEQHNVVKKRGPGRDFASETTDDPGVNYTKKFKRAGRYKLICTIHPEKMVLKLKVRD